MKLSVDGVDGDIEMELEDIHRATLKSIRRRLHAAQQPSVKNPNEKAKAKLHPPTQTVV